MVQRYGRTASGARATAASRFGTRVGRSASPVSQRCVTWRCTRVPWVSKGRLAPTTAHADHVSRPYCTVHTCCERIRCPATPVGAEFRHSVVPHPHTRHSTFQTTTRLPKPAALGHPYLWLPLPEDALPPRVRAPRRHEQQEKLSTTTGAMATTMSTTTAASTMYQSPMLDSEIWRCPMAM